MLKRIVPLLLSVFLLTGCWGTKNIDHVVYIHSVGIDYKNNKFIVYVQLISFTGLAKAEAGGGQQKINTTVGKATGKTFNIVTDNIYPSIQQMVSWGHVKAIVFTDRALKRAPLEDVFDVLDRYNEIRHTLWVYATKERLDKLFSTVPLLQASVYFSLLANPIEIFEQSSFIRPIRLNRFVADINEPGKTVRIPYLTISKTHWEENHKIKPMLAVSGICFLKHYKLQTCINRSDLKGMRWVEKDISRTPIYVKKGGNVVASIVVLGPTSTISYKQNTSFPQFTIEIKAKGSLIELRKPLTEKQLLALAKKTVEQEVRDLYMRGLTHHIDIFNLSETLYQERPKEWKKVSVNGSIPLRKETLKTVKVDLSIDTSGTRKFTVDEQNR
ncbi:Ger(x)C family spore germination protein [Anoxybacteroides amylolyticum]|uniref:Germination, Ger(X)C family protein n=1 Tax=Anoxybacteroides amylolyticum TaxID=294699 RepID=A0A160F2B5_9BACL|nr:Ger(x)C family spore germination protein [Anoxybacillus amylolyticus]ANB59755.1 germination, Ger(x)C family protein [Anoxybacillus amylolyticus]